MRARGGLLAGLAALLLGARLAASPADPPGASALRAAWAAHAPAVRGPIPAVLEAGDFATLAAGEAVTRRWDQPPAEAGGRPVTWATGAIWVPTPVQAPWIEICDAPHAPPSRLHVTRIPGPWPPGVRTVYSLLDLPWPFDDRQWVSRLEPDADLHARDPALWRRTWRVVDPALAPDPDPDAVWMVENRGAWTMLDLGENAGTLVVFTLRTVLGGRIPAGVSQRFALLGLADALERLAARAPGMRAHYGAGHEPVYAPDGRAIPPGSW